MQSSILPYCLFVLFLAFCHPAQAESTKKILSNGLIYQKLISKKNQIVHVLTIDPTYFRLKPVRAKSFFLNRETVASLAKQHQAVAAINGGFFKIQNKAHGLPAGILKIENEWHNIAYLPRGAIGWSSNANVVLFDRIQTQTSIIINQRKMPLNAFNQPNARQKSILYNYTYPYSIKPIKGQTTLLIQDHKIVKTLHEKYSIYDPKQYVYTLHTRYKLPRKLQQPETPVQIQVKTLPSLNRKNYSKWQTVEHIVGGAPLLIQNGKRIPYARSEQLPRRFLQKPYARTAIGILKNGHFVLVVSEYNPSLKSLGMSISELTHFLHNLGCVQALNLDGGGSSTLYINQETINHTEGDADEGFGIIAPRMVSDAIVVIPKPTSNK